MPCAERSVANDNFVNLLRASRRTCVLVSEEVPEPIIFTGEEAGNYW